MSRKSTPKKDDPSETAGGRPRAYVPMQIMRLLGSRVKVALETEHLEYTKQRGEGLAFSYIRFCEETSIPYNTIRAITSGQRVPSIFDLLDISRFTGYTVDQFLDGLPTNAALRRLWEEEQAAIEANRIVSLNRDLATNGLKF